jgi:uncharacterized protein
LDYLLLYMGVGVLAGLSAGLLGVGGGAITVPLLLWIFELRNMPDEVATHVALATSLAAMVFTSISSTLAHAGRQAVLWPVFGYLTVGVLLGSLVGVLTAISISGTVLQIGFALFLGYVGLQMLLGFSAGPHRRIPGSAGLIGSGGVIGCISMYFGIGGGSLTVPLLSYCGVPPAKAVGTSAALGLPIALWGSILYIVSGWQDSHLPEQTLGYVYWPAALGILLTSVLFARFGAQIAHKLKASQLRKVFGMVLGMVALEMLIGNLL